MPRDCYRIEVRADPSLCRRIARLKAELEDTTGKKITRNDLLVGLLEQALDRVGPEIAPQHLKSDRRSVEG